MWKTFTASIALLPLYGCVFSAALLATSCNDVLGRVFSTSPAAQDSVKADALDASKLEGEQKLDKANDVPKGEQDSVVQSDDAKNEVGQAKRLPKAPVDPDDLDLGGLSNGDIQFVVIQHADALKACYEANVAKDKALGGRVDVSFTIGRSGSVSDASVTSTTLNHKVVEDCIIALIKSWRFPAPQPSGTVKVNYPFVFEAQTKN